MYGKAITHMIRISAIIKSLENAFNIVKNLNTLNKHQLCKELDHHIKEEYLKDNLERYCISADVLKSAKDLVEYFVLNRLILAGYTSNLNYDSIHDNIGGILKKVKDRNSCQL